MKKVLALFLTILLTASLAACGSASKPESAVTGFCDALKAFDLEKASSYFASADAVITNPYVTGDAEDQEIFSDKTVVYLTGRAKEMTYTLGTTATDGDTATIPVTFTYVDASPVISEALTEYILQAFTLAFSEDADTVPDDLFETVFMEKTTSVSTQTATATIELVCTKQDDQWKLETLSDDAQKELRNVISCNMTKAMEEFAESFGGDSSEDDLFAEDYVWQDIPAGEVLELATVKMAVTGCQETDKLTAEYFDPDVAPEGTKFVVLTVELENITKSTLEFSHEFSLYDDQEREYESYSNALWYFDETFSYTELAPNIKTTGTLVYQVPADAQGYYLVTSKAGTNEAYRFYPQ